MSEQWTLAPDPPPGHTDTGAVRPPLAELIRRRRQRWELTQAELAYVLGVSPRTVGAWEAGTCRPRRKLWPQLARELVVDVADLRAAAEQQRRQR
jgi:DNA-binding XRE family transcriptional regulator